MSKILDLAEDFERKSREQAGVIESNLKSEFERHEQFIKRELRSNEQRITDDINAQSERLSGLVLKTWIWLPVTVVSVLLVAWGVIWIEGQVIYSRTQELIELQANIKALESKGGKIHLSECGERICIAAAEDSGKWTRNSDDRPMFIPEGY